MIPKPNVSWKYDKHHDVLHVFVADEPPCSGYYGDEVFPGVVIERAELDDRIIGVIIFDYSQKNIALLTNVVPFLKHINLPQELH